MDGGTPTVIYGLIDPRDGAMRYIGKTINPKARMSLHRSEARTRTDLPNKRCAWIRELLALGLQPRMVILTETTWYRAHETERALVAGYLQQGVPLLNALDGLHIGKPEPHVIDAIRAAVRRRVAINHG